MKANLLRLQSEWETFQSTHARDAVYQYLTAVFELVAWWACKRVGQSTVHLRHCKSVRELEPFAAVIYCTSDPEKVDDRTRSKWSRVLRYAAEYKDLAEPLRDFIKRKGEINKCAARFARCLGRSRQSGARAAARCHSGIL